MEKDAVSSRREPVQAHTASLKVNLILKGGIPAILYIKVRLQVFRSTVPYLEKVEALRDSRGSYVMIYGLRWCWGWRSQVLCKMKSILRCEVWCYGAPHLWISPFYHNTLELPRNCFGLVALWIGSLVPTYVFFFLYLTPAICYCISINGDFWETYFKKERSTSKQWRLRGAVSSPKYVLHLPQCISRAFCSVRTVFTSLDPVRHRQLSYFDSLALN